MAALHPFRLEVGDDLGHRVTPLYGAQLLVSEPARELGELLPRYQYDNRFDSTKFITAYPDFKITRYRSGLGAIRDEADAGEDR